MSLGQATSSNGQIPQSTGWKSCYPQARTYQELQSKILIFESSLIFSGHFICNQEFKVLDII